MGKKIIGLLIWSVYLFFGFQLHQTMAFTCKDPSDTACQKRLEEDAKFNAEQAAEDANNAPASDNGASSAVEVIVTEKIP